MKSTKRFIAGASCPNCGAIDSLQLDLQDQTISCVDCGHRQQDQYDQKSDKNKAGAAQSIPIEVIQS